MKASFKTQRCSWKQTKFQLKQNHALCSDTMSLRMCNKDGFSRLLLKLKNFFQVPNLLKEHDLVIMLKILISSARSRYEEVIVTNIFGLFGYFQMGFPFPRGNVGNFQRLQKSNFRSRN